MIQYAQGTGLADQGIALADQGTGLADQGIALADQGIALADQGIALADQGIALADQESALVSRGAKVVSSSRSRYMGGDVCAGFFIVARMLASIAHIPAMKTKIQIRWSAEKTALQNPSKKIAISGNAERAGGSTT